ncbi:MAG: thiamine pyrophosphate-binding protein [Proteobacteria bacterium]|nr:thiamine pyrophosphate-binding protein [Pseudomonadota bacterium]
MAGNSETGRETGGEALVRALLEEGTEHIFCLPGESYLAVLDALHDVADRIKLITCRHEGGAANMAEAAGKLPVNGIMRPGICFVTRGPGATHASIGVHTALQNSTPMILFIGQVPRPHLGREAFQEIDYRQMFTGVAKHVMQVEDAARMAEAVHEAFAIALSGRPGPVVVALPEDMLRETCDVTPPRGPTVRETRAPGQADVAAVLEALKTAERPLAILGGPGWSDAGMAAAAKFLEANEIPAAVAFRSQDLIDNRHGCYAGDLGFTVNGALVARLRDADVILALGTRLGEITTGGYEYLTAPRPDQRLIHIHAGAGELGRVYEAEVSVHADPGAFASAIAGENLGRADDWRDWRQAARADYETWLKPHPVPGPVQLGEIVEWLNQRLPEDAIITNGAGNYTGWLHRNYQYKAPHTQLAPKSGAMGYGVPAAVAAKIIQPGRTVVCFAGDGCFLMTGQELATAVRYGAAVIFLVFNNAMYGTIRMHQERDYPGRVSGTDLTNPDFVAYAEAFGANGVRVTQTQEFAPAFEKALTAALPTLIEIAVDAEAITTGATLSGIRGS